MARVAAFALVSNRIGCSSSQRIGSRELRHPVAASQAMSERRGTVKSTLGSVPAPYRTVTPPSMLTRLVPITNPLPIGADCCGAAGAATVAGAGTAAGGALPRRLRPPG